MLKGTGICIPSVEDLSSIVGFFTTRTVQATTIEGAEREAQNMVLSEWLSGKYADANMGSMPVLSVESVSRISFLESFRSANAGYSFYLEENKENTEPAS
jgi:hypothetical protein